MKKIKYAAGLLAILLLAGCGKAAQPEEMQETPTTALTLEEAVALAWESAEDVYPSLHLTEVNSYDNDASPSMTAGEDSAREKWYVNFGNEEGNYVSVYVSEGEIVNVFTADQNANNGLFDLSELCLTAEQAVELAKSLGLQGGDPAQESQWVSGYNFYLTYGSLAETSEEMRIFFEVIGISPDGNLAHVDLDGKTGELLLCIEEIDDADGNPIEWRPFSADS